MFDQQLYLQSQVHDGLVFRRGPVGEMVTNLPVPEGLYDFGNIGIGSKATADHALAFYCPNIPAYLKAKISDRFHRELVATLPDSVGGDLPGFLIKAWIGSSANQSTGRFIEAQALQVLAELPPNHYEALDAISRCNEALISPVRNSCKSHAEEVALLVASAAGAGRPEFRIGIAIFMKKSPGDLWPLSPRSWIGYEDQFVPGFGSFGASYLF